MSRKSRRFGNASAAGNPSENEITKLVDEEHNQHARFGALKQHWKKRLLYPVLGFSLLMMLGLGAMASNNWLPHTDALSGKRSGWFGRNLGATNTAASSSSVDSTGSSSLLPFEPLPTPTAPPQLSKEYIYAGSRMLAVEDANANAAPPTDLAVWRPGDGTWYILNSSNQQMTSLQWGVSTDTPVRGDFDGDGKTDFCVFRPADGVWHQLRSSDNQYVGQQFGATGDKPVPADYDGDGKTDIAFFRSSNLYWYILRSSDATLMSIQFGAANDKPVPADYDGDGKADVAQYRKSTADWIWAQSANNYAPISQHFGANGTDDPVTGDYDGDGKYDFAVWRTTDNTWYINNSSNNSLTAIQWGNNTIDTAVQGDYDADGKTDIAVWRNQGSQVGLWQIRNSSTGQARTASWGTTNDIPVPAPYRR